MVGRASSLASTLAEAALRIKSNNFINVFSKSPIHIPPLSPRPLFHSSSLDELIFKVPAHKPDVWPSYNTRAYFLPWCALIHSYSPLNAGSEVPEKPKNVESSGSAGGSGEVKLKRKKLKGKRAVVRWLKFFRWKKKKEYERMTAEEKILYKLRKARKKEERLVAALKKIEPAESSGTTHDPEILTPEEHFFFLKMGLKCKNYVPIGRRGIYQGVILNMHLHWKKHQTLQVVVKTFSPEEVKDIAAELARLTGGIVLDIHKEDTIIMYRGKNYCQPPTEIMSPRVTLSRKKALDKSKHRDGLRAVRKYIPRLEQDLELLQALSLREESLNIGNNNSNAAEEIHTTDLESNASRGMSNMQVELDKPMDIVNGAEERMDEDPNVNSDMVSDSDDLSDIFETDSEDESQGKIEQNLYLDAFEKLVMRDTGETEGFEEHLHKISLDSRNENMSRNEGESPELDEVDRMFLRAASLLKKKR